MTWEMVRRKIPDLCPFSMPQKTMGIYILCFNCQRNHNEERCPAHQWIAGDLHVRRKYMSTACKSLTASQSRGRTFFICALLLLAVMLFEPIATSLVSGKRGIGDSIFTSIIYILVLAAAFRGGFLSLKIIRVCLGISAAILVLAVFLIGIGSLMGKLPPPKIGWDMHTLRDFASAIPLAYIYWALFFSKSVKEFIICQRE